MNEELQKAIDQTAESIKDIHPYILRDFFATMLATAIVKSPLGKGNYEAFLADVIEGAIQRVEFRRSLN